MAKREEDTTSRRDPNNRTLVDLSRLTPRRRRSQACRLRPAGGRTRKVFIAKPLGLLRSENGGTWRWNNPEPEETPEQRETWPIVSMWSESELDQMESTLIREVATRTPSTDPRGRLRS